MTTVFDLWAPPASYADDLRARYPGTTAVPRWGIPRSAGFTPGWYEVPWSNEAQWFDDRPSYGSAACKIMDVLGTPSMPHQRYYHETGLELNEDTGFRTFRYRRVGLSITRQMGKTQTILGTMVWRVKSQRRNRVIYAAQTRLMARERLEKEFSVGLAESRGFDGLWKLTLTSGMESINWLDNHSYIGIVANTPAAGHGPPLDMGVIDEAFAHMDSTVEQAMSPAMLTRPLAQLWWASAAGTDRSLWLNQQRESGRKQIERGWATGDWGDQFYVEYYEPESAPRDDPATWFRMMPALCPRPPCQCGRGAWRHTATVASIKAELSAMQGNPAEFDRAYLNRTRRETPPPDPNVPTKEWPSRAQVKSRLPLKAAVAFAVDITPQRDHASIAVYGIRRDGMGHSELVDRRPGADWVVDALLRLRRIWSPVAIGLDPLSPAGAILARLEQAGIMRPEARADSSPYEEKEPKRGDLWCPTTHEYAAACALFADAVARDKTLIHIDQPEANTAVMGARTRTLGDAWAWSRRTASVDISPLVSMTVARAAYLARVQLVLKEYDPIANIG